MGNITSGIENSEQSIEIYTKKLILMLEDAHNAHAFEYFFLNHEIPKDMWTFSSALVFTTTTVIPVGKLISSFEKKFFSKLSKF